MEYQKVSENNFLDAFLFGYGAEGSGPVPDTDEKYYLRQQA
jgi:hypothetical protein